MSRITQVGITSTPAGRRPILETGNTTVTVGPPVIVGVTELQTLGAFSGTVDVDIPAGAATSAQDVSFVSVLTPGIPNAFTLTAGSSGLIGATCYLVAQPDDQNLIVGCPAISLTFGTGLPTQAGSGTWDLRPQIQYQGPQLSVVVRCFSAAHTDATTLTFVLGGVLVGFPSAS